MKLIIHHRTCRGKKHGFWGLSALLFLTLFAIAGCDGNSFEFLADDNSDEARIEEARMAIDDENYEKARSILEGMSLGNFNVRQYLSNAYAGLGGMDTFRLLETLDDMNDDAGDGDGSLDLIGRVHGAADNTISRELVEEKMFYFNRAIDLLYEVPFENEPDDIEPGDIDSDRAVMPIEGRSNLGTYSLEEIYAEAGLTDDQRIQIGLLCLNHALFIVSEIIMIDQGILELELTEEAINIQYQGQSANFSDWAEAGELTFEYLLEKLSRDIFLLAESVEAIAEIIGHDVNDLTEEFDEFLAELDKNRDQQITRDEIENYVNSL